MVSLSVSKVEVNCQLSSHAVNVCAQGVSQLPVWWPGHYTAPHCCGLSWQEGCPPADGGWGQVDTSGWWNGLMTISGPIFLMLEARLPFMWPATQGTWFGFSFECCKLLFICRKSWISFFLQTQILTAVTLGELFHIFVSSFFTIFKKSWNYMGWPCCMIPSPCCSGSVYLATFYQD